MTIIFLYHIIIIIIIIYKPIIINLISLARE